MTRFVFADHAYDASQPSGSWWHDAGMTTAPALAGAIQADVAIVGGGVVGLNAALHLAATHSADVVLLEAGDLGWGASGRNGGFCCDGAAKLAPAALVRRFGEVEARRFFRLQMEAIEHVAHLLERLGIGDARHGDGETYLAHRPVRRAAFAAALAEVTWAYGVAVTVQDRSELAAAGIQGPHFHFGAHVPVGFGIDSGRYLEALAHAAVAGGARLFARSRVTGIAGDDGAFRLRTAAGEVRARRLIVATNAYTDEDLVPALRGRLLPAFSNVLVTRPLRPGELAAQGWTTDRMAFDSRELLHYFRLLPDRRFLFGGRGGLSGRPGGQARTQAKLVADFRVLFPAWRDVAISHQWSGLVCLTRNLLPYVGRLDAPSGAWTALGWHGNGIAMGSLAGALVADLALGRRRPSDLPAALTQQPRRFPLPRTWLLRAAYAWFERRDGPLRADP